MTSLRREVPAALVPAAQAGGAVLLIALFVAALGLRPQLVGAGPLLPAIEEDLATSHAVVGVLPTIPVLCMGLFAPFAGRLSGRLGLRWAMATCLAVIALAGLARAAAPGAPALLVLTLPIGMGMAFAGALIPVAVKLRFAHRPAFASGIATTGINAGAALSSAVAVPAAAAFGGWRGALLAFSLATVVLAGGWLALSRGAWSERSSERAPRMPVRRPIAWVIVLMFGLQSLVYYGLVAWIADAYQERGWSDASAGAVLAVMGAAAIPSGLLITWFADRVGDRRTWSVGAACSLALGTLGFAAVPEGGYAWALMCGGAMGVLFPMCLAMCIDVARVPAEAGAVAALMFLAGYPIAALAPLGLGLVRDATGAHTTSLWLLTGVAVLLVLSCLPLTPSRLRPHDLPVTSAG